MVQGPGLRQWTLSHLLILTNVARPIQVFVELDADGDGAVDPHSRNHDTKDFYSLEIINFEPRRHAVWRLCVNSMTNGLRSMWQLRTIRIIGIAQ